MGLIKKLRKAKKEAPPNEKPTVVKTHLRNMIIVPEMIGSVVGIYNGKVSSFGLIPPLFMILNLRQGVQLGRNQARDGRPLPCRVLHFLQGLSLNLELRGPGSNIFYSPSSTDDRVLVQHTLLDCKHALPQVPSFPNTILQHSSEVDPWIRYLLSQYSKSMCHASFITPIT